MKTTHTRLALLTQLTLINIALHLLATPAAAFDYLEHLYVTDVACSEAREWLIAEGEGALNEELSARLLALALSCPIEALDADPAAPYCAGGYKRARSLLTAHAAPLQDTGDYPLTLGDIAAAPDHLGELGALRGLPRASKEGVISLALGWLSAEDGGVDGIIEDVAEDACEGAHLADWRAATADLRAASAERAAGRPPAPPTLSAERRAPLARAPLLRGPSDPAGAYSFDNPHYLDLVFRNHHHFGARAYSAWLGLHDAALAVAARPCEETLAVTDDLVKRLAPDAEDLSGAGRRARACEGLAGVVASRLALLGALAPDLHARLAARVPGLAPRPSPALAARARDALLGLLLEAEGLHFLEDMYAGGHMRTIRTRGGLMEARYDHDSDNRDGVSATLQTHRHTHPLIAYGDGFLLGFGPRPTPESASDAQRARERAARAALSAQRRAVGLAATASLVDWARGGLLYPPEGEHLDLAAAATTAASVSAPPQSARALVEGALPTRPALMDGEEDLSPAPRYLGRANLPVPPPPFSYEVLSSRAGFDVAGRGLRFGLQLALVDTLGTFATWLKGYRFGLNADLGDDERDRWGLDLGYSFHWRWAARFTLDAGLLSSTGWRALGSPEGAVWQVGVTPYAGFSLLPEGWVKAPLEVSVSYQLPLTFYDSARGFPGAELIEGHMLMVSLGLAFMR